MFQSSARTLRRTSSQYTLRPQAVLPSARTGPCPFQSVLFLVAMLNVQKLLASHPAHHRVSKVPGHTATITKRGMTCLKWEGCLQSTISAVIDMSLLPHQILESLHLHKKLFTRGFCFGEVDAHEEETIP